MTSIRGSRVLVDSDALIGLIHKDDQLHKRCFAVSQFLAYNSCATIVPYPIVLEAATTLAKDKMIRRPDLAEKLLRDYAAIEEKVNYDVGVADLVASIYSTSFKQRSNTPFDHYVLALAKKNNIKYVFSFDSFYKKNGLTLMEDLLK